MDKLLKGIIDSDHPQSLKQQFIDHLIIPASSQNISPEECVSLLKVAWETSLYGESEFIRNIGIKIFETWSSNNKGALIEFINTINLIYYFNDASLQHKDILLKLIKCCLENIEDSVVFSNLCIIIQKNCICCLQGNYKTSTLKALIILLKTFPQCIPDGLLGGNLLENIIYYIAYINIPKHYNLTQFIMEIDSISAFLPNLWKNNETLINKAFNAISTLLSSEKACSAVLASIIDVLPLELIDRVKSIASCWESVESLKLIITRILDWLSWPTAKNIDKWILAVLITLAEQKKFQMLIEIFTATIEMVFKKLEIPFTRKASLKILKYMLLSYQHSPILFHKIAKNIPKTLTNIEDKNNGFPDDDIQEMVELFHTLMYLHSGFPDLYDPIIKKFEKFKMPSKEKMLQLLSTYKWENKIKKRVKSETGMAGLNNIGNTCYLNCILQALYMTDYFRYLVLKSVPKPEEKLLFGLQEVFAYLSLTERPSFSPNHFLEISKPPWFESGQQQDCAEFLNFLFDSLIEQNRTSHHSLQLTENEDHSLIEDMFSGVSETTYLCFECNNSSVRSEKFTSLHLAIHKNCEDIKEKLSNESSDIKDEINIELNDLIINYLKPEILDGENKYFCDKCKELQTGKKQSRIIKYPVCLIITLLRFSYSPVHNKKTKITSVVNYPFQLMWPLDENNYKTYHLYAVVIHSGNSTERGHYYTYARHSSSSSNNDTAKTEQRWYVFNDSHIFLTSYNSLETLTRQFPRDTAYVLFYQEIPNEKCNSLANENINNFIHTELKEFICKDNIKYLEEQEVEHSIEQIQRTQKNLMFSKRFHRDFDGSPPPGGCGSSDLSFPRFVY